MKNRNWHKDFISYMKYIVEHENYSGLYKPYKENGEVRWVAPKKSKIGSERNKWWENHLDGRKLITKSDVAREIHPKGLNGLKPCQICGKELSVFYDYPTKITLKKINSESDHDYASYELTIGEIIKDLSQRIPDTFLDILNITFKLNLSQSLDRDKITQNIKAKCQSKLSPGVMSNAPDRFDGFHSYNACCRKKEDTGRYDDNMKTYTQDRRAYEYWSDGDFNAANRLMGEFQKDRNKYKCPKCNNRRRMTADHIGPISLGFCHRKKFQPLCKTCNSQKNNRMTYDDIQILLSDESENINVISWHSRFIWNLLKLKVRNDKDARKLSRLLSKNMKSILAILSSVHLLDGGRILLKTFLNIEYAFFDIRYENFNPFDLDLLITHKKTLNSENKKKNSERVERISFEVLEKFKNKNNRRIKSIRPGKERTQLKKIENLLNDAEMDQAKKCLLKIIREKSYQISLEW